MSLRSEQQQIKDSPDVIYLPGAKISKNLELLLSVARYRHKDVISRYPESEHPKHYLTLDQLDRILEHDVNGKDPVRRLRIVNHAISEMLDLPNGGKRKMGYIYPILVKQSNKIVPKILIISPQEVEATPIEPIRKSCFSYSQRLIDYILTHKSRTQRKKEENLFRETKRGDKWLFPRLFSLESDFETILKKAFSPYNYFALPDFFRDIMEYGLETGKIVQVLPDYHIIPEDPSVYNGSSVQIEAFFHYRSQSKGLELFALERMKEKALQNKDTIFIRSIDSFEDRFKNRPVEKYEDLRYRTDELLKCIANFSFPKKISDESIQNIKETSALSVKIITALADILVRSDKIKTDSTITDPSVSRQDVTRYWNLKLKEIVKAKEENVKDESKSDFNFKSGFLGFTISLAYILILYTFFGHSILTYLSVPFSLMIGFISGKSFKK